MNKQADTRHLQALDQAHHLHPFTDLGDYSENGGRIVSRAEHIYIYDSDGHKMLDGMSGLWCCNLGYSQQSIMDAISAQLQDLPFYNNFFRCSNQPAVELASALVEITPPQFNHVFFTNSGSEANDTNLRLVQRYYGSAGQALEETYYQPSQRLPRLDHRRGLTRRNERHARTEQRPGLCSPHQPAPLVRPKVATTARMSLGCAWPGNWRPR